MNDAFNTRSQRPIAIRACALLLVASCLLPRLTFAQWHVYACRSNGETAAGVCTAWNEDHIQIQLADLSTLEWPRSELVRIDSVTESSPTSLPWPLDPRETRLPVDPRGLVILPSDDRLVIQSDEISENALAVIVAASDTPIAIPWESIACWIATRRPDADDLLRGTATRADRLLLTNGDMISGEFLQFAGEGILIETTAGELMIENERIVAASFNPELTSLPDLPASSTIALLTDGSRITATDCELSDDVVHITTLFGATMSVPVTSILQLHCFSDNVVSLTTLPVEAWEFEPYVPADVESIETSQPEIPADGPLLERANPAWDRSPLGGPVLIRGTEFPRGLGLRPRSRLTVSLDGEYQHFQATVGVDDRAHDRGSVEFRVESQGETLWASPIVAGGDPPLETGLIDIAGREELTLVVDFADWGDLFDLAVWGNPVLLRASDE